MNVEASKMHLEKVDAAFEVLKKDPDNASAIKTIEKELKLVFDDTFYLAITKAKMKDPWSVMAVYPSKATMDKIVESIMKEEPVPVVRNLWEKNREWYIEIDIRTLVDIIIPISARQLTSLVLHEIGHVKESNAIPNRIAKVVKYQYAQLQGKVKMVFKTPGYRAMVAMPIVDTMSIKASAKRKGIEQEFEADAFAEKYGYGTEIANVLEAIMNRSSAIELDGDASMMEVMHFVSKAVGDLAERRSRLTHESWMELMESNSSPYIGEYYKEILECVYHNYTDTTEASLIAESGTRKIVDKYYSQFESDHYVEFFGLKKKLKPLKPYELDYIAVEIDKIRTHSDKMLILSYAHSKLDIVDYYISIMKNPKFAKKYVIPHTMEFLTEYRSRVQNSINKALNTRIDDPNYGGISINYPTGYEG